MKIHQSTDIDEPLAPRQVANKQYVDKMAAAGAAAPVFVTDVTNAGSGIVGNKTYVPNTVPANTVITAALSDDDTVGITVLAEGGSAFYSPVLTVTGSPALAVGQGSTIALAQDQYDKRTFTGTALVTISGTTTVTITSDTGATTSVVVNRAAAGPAVSALTIGAYPGVQTAVRSGQTVSFTGTVANEATAVDIVAFGAGAAKAGAATFGAADSAGSGLKTFTGTFTVSAGTGALAIRATAKNSLGTYGNTFTSSNTIILDQVLPTVTAVSVAYPGVQEAIKGTEQSTVSYTIANAANSTTSVSGVISVLSGGGSLSSSVVVQGTGSGDVITGTNVTITANKPANGSTVTVTTLVKVVNASQVNSISVVGSPVRLISSAAGQAYTVYIESTLDLIGDGAGQAVYAPTFTAPVGLLSGITRINDKRWQATLTIKDTDARGVTNFNAISTTGLSGIQVTTATGTAYNVGGFTERTLVIPLFSPGVIGRTVDLGAAVGDVSKLSANLSGTVLTFTPDVNDASLKFTISDVGQGFGTPYTQVAAYDAHGHFFYLNDRDQAGANTTGTMTVTIREDA